jgi:hypothetical protein
MADYVKFAETAKRLIEKNGRTLTLVKADRAPADAAKPWNGPAEPGAPVRVDGKGVQWDYKLTEIGGDTVKQGDKRFLFATNSFQGHDLKTFNFVIDGTDEWSIANAEIVKPGDTEIIAILQVRK